MHVSSRIKAWIFRHWGSVPPEQVRVWQKKILDLPGPESSHQEPDTQDDCLQELKRQLCRDAMMLPKHRHAVTVPAVSVPGKTKEIDLLYKKLKKDAPAAFKTWQTLFKNNVDCYKGFPTHSCSVKGHAFADLFRYYVALHANGRILDIGCGPQPVPYYIDGYPDRLIAGVDPIPAEHPFTFFHGPAEYLPWKDASFETVICATSLEHVILLDKVLDEIHRVLKKNGVFILWTAFIPGAEKYDPYSEPVVPVDSYHLFQFDKPWFEETIKPHFDVLHSVDYQHPMISSFYLLKPKPDMTETPESSPGQKPRKRDTGIDACMSWPASFKKLNGHAPRILHIGNIANNAYNNAKLLIDAGMDCDVICYDYYHIMGCPEWEDADFKGDLKDHFFPSWESVDLGGFQRPRWFAQGKMQTCIRYLLSKRAHRPLLTRWYWYFMTLEARALCRIFRQTQVLKTKQPVGLRFILHCNDWITKTWGDPIRSVIQKSVSGKPSFAADHEAVEIQSRFIDLIHYFKTAFPERKDPLEVNDLIPYTSIISLWRSLFQHYDIIMAYSTDGILPLLTRSKYLCLEHGTLRDIPFAADSQGRKTALCYHLADHVFVTNSDCLDNAQKLTSKEKISFINHPYDEDHGLNQGKWQELRQALMERLDATFLFFFPTRHDWVQGKGFADKANDIFLNAFTKLRNQGVKVGAVCCSWGNNVQESKALLEEAGCINHVLWKEPMGTIAFETTGLACHLLVDQFKLGSFGGILFKSMSTGIPVCTYLNVDEMLDRYNEVPPVLNCSTSAEIINHVKACIETPLILKDLGIKSRQWIKKYYCSADTIRTQLNVFQASLSRARDGVQNPLDTAGTSVWYAGIKCNIRKDFNG